jgi:Glucose / Sorbosone dehydrogenase
MYCPRGGDELNLIEPGKNYGWQLVSYAVNYNGVPIPSPDSRPDLAKPVLYWTPIIAPGNLIFYDGKMFPQWKGSALVSGLASRALIRIVVNGACTRLTQRTKPPSASSSVTSWTWRRIMAPARRAPNPAPTAPAHDSARDGRHRCRAKKIGPCR